MKLTAVIVLAIPAVLFAAEPKRMSYPVTRTDPVVEKIHGVEIVDPYRWLEDADNADVKQCRTQNPDGSFTRDTCPYMGGLDQNIYGAVTP